MSKLTVSIPDDLHQKIREELEKQGITTSQFIEQAVTNFFENPKGETNMATRTLAFQVSEELFQRVKAYLARYEEIHHRKLSQKEFVIGLIEAELDEADEEFEAAEAAAATENPEVEQPAEETETDDPADEDTPATDEDAPDESEHEQAEDDSEQDEAYEEEAAEDTEDAEPDSEEAEESEDATDQQEVDGGSFLVQWNAKAMKSAWGASIPSCVHPEKSALFDSKRWARGIPPKRSRRASCIHEATALMLKTHQQSNIAVCAAGRKNAAS